MSKSKSGQEKKVRCSPIRVAKNLWFLLRYTFRYMPMYAVATLGEAFGRGAYHVFGVLFTKYLFDAKVSCVKKYMRKYFGFSALCSLLRFVIPSVGVTGYLIVRYIVNPALSLGGFSASIQACFALNDSLEDIIEHITRFNSHSPYIDKIKKFLQYEPKIKGNETHVPAFRELTVRNVSFSYPFASDGKKILVMSVC